MMSCEQWLSIVETMVMWANELATLFRKRF